MLAIVEYTKSEYVDLNCFNRDLASYQRSDAASKPFADNKQWKLNSPRPTTMLEWCAATDPLIEAGLSRMSCVPGNDVLQALIERGGIEAPTGKAGGLILFDCNTLHGSNANMSPDPRSNVFFVYNRRDNVCDRPYAARRRRPSFLAHGPGETWTP